MPRRTSLSPTNSTMQSSTSVPFSPGDWSKILQSPACSKSNLLLHQNFKRWILELSLIVVGFFFYRGSYTLPTLAFFTVAFEIILLRNKQLRGIRNSQPYKLYITYLLIHALLIVIVDGYFSDVFGAVFRTRRGGNFALVRDGGYIGAPPPLMVGTNTVDRSAVVVKDGEAVRTPYSRVLDATFRTVADSTMQGSAYVTGDDVSVIIPVRDESEYLAKTIMYTVQNTPRQYLREFIVVDDASEEPISNVLDRELPRNVRGLVRVLRYETKEGLIRARIAGADLAKSTNIFFLDGHCRPKPGWVEPLIRHLKTNYKRVACPVIQDITAETWEETGTSGFKMMFEWNFEFGWYDDLTDEVPVSAGGILAMTKKWWSESGKYDPGMLEWGGENIEQSIRIWLCGGEIYVVRESNIGHIFNRPAKPNPENKLVTQVQKNQKRAALVWLDDYYKFFEHHHPVVKGLDHGPGLEERVALRHKMGCMPFQWYVDRFRTAFERKSLLDEDFLHIQHQHSRWCLGVVGPNPVGVDAIERNQHHVVLMPCDKYTRNQQWQAVGGQRLLFHRQSGKCLDSFGSQKGSPKRDKRPIVYQCDWNGVFQVQNRNQFWQYDAAKHGRIFTHYTDDSATLTGHDVFTVDPSIGVKESSLCLTADLPHWNAWDWSSDDAHFKAHNRYTRDIYYTSCHAANYTMSWTDPQEFHPVWNVN